MHFGTHTSFKNHEAKRESRSKIKKLRFSVFFTISFPQKVTDKDLYVG